MYTFLAFIEAVNPASQSFTRESSDPDAKVSNRWTRCDSTGKNGILNRSECVAWYMFTPGYLTLIPFDVAMTLSNGRVT